MKKKIPIPDSYFDNQEFLSNEKDFDGEEVLGVLGKHPSPEQILKYELCSSIAYFLDSHGLSLSQANELFNINISDISRIRNFQLDRFTIDRLMKFYVQMDSVKNLSTVLSNAAVKIKKLST